MASVTTTKSINLYQLGVELGGNPGLRKDGDVITCATVTQAALQAAVTAHVADPAVVAPPSAAEVRASAETEAETAILTALRSGVTAITAARQAAVSDQATADTLRTQIAGVKSAASTQKTGVDAFAPGTTYKQSDLTAIKTALSAILARQLLIIDAIDSLTAWRRAVDVNAVTTDDALIGLARIQADVVLDD